MVSFFSAEKCHSKLAISLCIGITLSPEMKFSEYLTTWTTIFREQRSNYGLIGALADAVTVVTTSVSVLVWTTTFMETWEFFRTANDVISTSYDILENV